MNLLGCRVYKLVQLGGRGGGGRGPEYELQVRKEQKFVQREHECAERGTLKV